MSEEEIVGWYEMRASIIGRPEWPSGKDAISRLGSFGSVLTFEGGQHVPGDRLTTYHERLCLWRAQAEQWLAKWRIGWSRSEEGRYWLAYKHDPDASDYDSFDAMVFAVADMMR